MNCEALKELINSVFDGEVPVETIASATHHLEGCADCHTQFHQLESLRERVIKYAEQIPVPAGLEERVRFKLRNAENSRKPQSKIYIVAAASLLLVGLGSFLLTARHDDPQTALTPTTTSKQIAVTAKQTFTLDDVVNHTKEHVVAYVDYSPQQLSQLSKESGFAIKPMQLVGWKIADICICDIGTQGGSAAHITYVKTEGKHRRFLTCYQSSKNVFQSAPMNREAGSGREIRCAQSGPMAIAYTADENVENVFVAPMPVKDLVHIARGA